MYDSYLIELINKISDYSKNFGITINNDRGDRMSSIKIQKSFLYKMLNVVIIGGTVTGSFKAGDILCNVDNHTETYTVKGIALMKLSDGSGSAIDIQLNTGNYNERDLIGKTLIKVE